MASITTELVETGSKRDGRGRKITTPAEKEALVAQYRDSGLTQRAFAEREGIKFSTFTAWVQGRRLASKGGRRVQFPGAAAVGWLRGVRQLRQSPRRGDARGLLGACAAPLP
jgi:transposase-like protein